MRCRFAVVLLVCGLFITPSLSATQNQLPPLPAELSYGEIVQYAVRAIPYPPPKTCETPFSPMSLGGAPLEIWYRNDGNKQALTITTSWLKVKKIELGLDKAVKFGAINFKHERVQLNLPRLLSPFVSEAEYFVWLRGWADNELNVIIELEPVNNPEKKYCRMQYWVTGIRYQPKN